MRVCDMCDQRPKGTIYRADIEKERIWICPTCAEAFDLKPNDPAVTIFTTEKIKGELVIVQKRLADEHQERVRHLPVGSVIRINDTTCTLLYVNECRASVRASTGKHHFQVSNGDEVEFEKRSSWNISPNTMCTVIKRGERNGKRQE